MRVWVSKGFYEGWPNDLLCVELNSEWLLYISERGVGDVAHVDCGMPSKGAWWRFDEDVDEHSDA